MDVDIIFAPSGDMTHCIIEEKADGLHVTLQAKLPTYVRIATLMVAFAVCIGLLAAGPMYYALFSEPFLLTLTLSLWALWVILRLICWHFWQKEHLFFHPSGLASRRDFRLWRTPLRTRDFSSLQVACEASTPHAGRFRIYNLTKGQEGDLLFESSLGLAHDDMQRLLRAIRRWFVLEQMKRMGFPELSHN